MAGRIRKPWYRRSKGRWYVCIDGRQVNLGKDKAEAFRRFHRLMAGSEQAGPATTAQSLPVSELAEQYLADMERRTTERTVYVARCYLKPILAECGGITAQALRKHHVEAAIRKHEGWNGTTENHVKSRVVAMMNWAVQEGLIAVNPIKGIKKPAARSRGSQAVIETDERERLVRAAPTYLRNVLVALHQTGARPSEVLTVTAQEFDATLGLWVLHEHKTADSTVRPRVVYLTPELTELCRELASKHPTGPLFRRASGKPFPPAYYLARLIRNLRRRLGLRESITPYSLRHTFATDALANGVPDAQVAELLGHSGTAMLHKHYAHLTARARALKEALGRVR
jgi:integrase